MNVLDIVGRNKRLFTADLKTFQKEIDDAVRSSRFLVIGGAGSIGQEVVKQIFRRQPRVLHVVDISENNLVELVRDIRSSLGYIDGDTQFLAIDFCSKEFRAFWNASEGYDYVLKSCGTQACALRTIRLHSDEDDRNECCRYGPQFAVGR